MTNQDKIDGMTSILKDLLDKAISNPDVEEHMGRVENCFNEIRKELRAMRKEASRYNK